jgi:hypothetical protein
MGSESIIAMAPRALLPLHQYVPSHSEAGWRRAGTTQSSPRCSADGGSHNGSGHAEVCMKLLTRIGGDGAEPQGPVFVSLSRNRTGALSPSTPAVRHKGLLGYSRVGLFGWHRPGGNDIGMYKAALRASAKLTLTQRKLWQPSNASSRNPE